MNGDGFADLIVGAPDFSDGQMEEGRIFLYLGSASWRGCGDVATFDSNLPGAHLGAAWRRPT